MELPHTVHAAVEAGIVSRAGVELAGAFAAFAPAFKRLVETAAPHDGVSVARMRLLHLLHQSGPQMMSHLRRGLGVTARNITQLVDGLERDGLARRAPHPTDRRAILVELTDIGRRTVEEGWSTHVIRVAELFDRLAPDDRTELLRIVNDLRGHMADMGIDGACEPQD
jgi:DNA-binding MarR family transcriptional regulator